MRGVYGAPEEPEMLEIKLWIEAKKREEERIKELAELFDIGDYLARSMIKGTEPGIIYIKVLESVSKSPYGKTYKQVSRDAGKNDIKLLLDRMKEQGFLKYDGKRWVLTEKGKALYRYLTKDERE